MRYGGSSLLNLGVHKPPARFTDATNSGLLVATQLAHRNRRLAALFVAVCALNRAQNRFNFGGFPSAAPHLARIQYETSDRSLLAQTPWARSKSLQIKALSAVAWSSL